MSTEAAGDAWGQYNAMLMARINAQFTNGMNASLQESQYVVIRNEATGVLSVVAASSVDEKASVMSGTFSQCLQYVNATMVAETAEKYPVHKKHKKRHRHKKKKHAHEPDTREPYPHEPYPKEADTHEPYPKESESD